MAHQSRSFWMNPSGHRRILPSKISGRTTTTLPTINRCHLVQLCSTNSLFSVRCWLTWIRICFPKFRSLIGPNGRSRRLWIQDPSGQTRGKDRTVTGRSAFVLFVLFPMTGSHKRQIVDSARLDFCSLFRFCLVEKCFAIYHFACCRVVKSCCIPALFDSIAHDIPTGTHHPPSLHRLIISKPDANVSLTKRTDDECHTKVIKQSDEISSSPPPEISSPDKI